MRRQLADTVWPEADGDAAHDSFKMALSRLRVSWLAMRRGRRRVRGKVMSLIHVTAGWTRGPSRGHCQIASRRRRVTEEDTADVRELAEKAMELYKGPFLPRTGNSAGVLPIASVSETSIFALLSDWVTSLEGKKEWRKAVEYYQRALEIDEFSEEFYQRLITCYQRLGHYPEAILAYRRCRAMLSRILEPNPLPRPRPCTGI